MTEMLFGALSMAVLLVRIIKGPWMRNPQYLAAALVGAVALSLGLGALSPDLENDLIVGTLAGGVGAWIGIYLFDLTQAGDF